jgi:hypothetical protein
MLNIKEIKAQYEAAMKVLAENDGLNFGKEYLQLIHAIENSNTLITEVERLTSQHQCDAHNLATMQATLNQQAENCEKLLESYKKSNLEQATENYELEQENAKLKSEVERLTAGNAALQSEKNKLVTQNRRIINREMGRDQQIVTLKKALELACAELADESCPNEWYECPHNCSEMCLGEESEAAKCWNERFMNQAQQLTHETHGDAEEEKK